MAINQWLNRNPAVVSLGAVALIAVAVAALLYNFGVFGGTKPDTSDKFYFYDMQTGELFPAQATLIPPIEAPSGGEGVLAQVYDCGDCANGHFVGLLQKYSPAAKKAIESGLPPSPSGDLVRLPDAGSTWVPADSEQGQQFRLQSVAAARAWCKGQEPSRCFPK